MSSVNVAPEILDSLASQISDIEERTQQSIAGTRSGASAVQKQIAEEVVRRRQRVEELTRQYEACQQQEGSDCSDLRRLLAKAQRRLEAGLKAQAIADRAASEHHAQATALLRKMGHFSLAGKHTLAKLKQHLDDYTAFNAIVPSGILNADYGSTTPGSAGGGIGGAAGSPNHGAGKLAQTNQSFQTVMSGNRELKVFDRPSQSSQIAVFNQGSAFPGQIEGTCGMCAVGSVLRLAGVNASEKDVTAFAVANGLCTTGQARSGRNGGTSGLQLAEILNGLGGISAEVKRGESLENLAQSIAQGKGVIIGVRASALNQPWYDPDKTDPPWAHWIVLQSVMRDAKTDEILGFYIFDSNGSSSDTTLQFIPTSRIQNAYARWQSQSVTTTDIIW